MRTTDARNLRALVVLLYLTGLRIGEALALKWSDVDFDNIEVSIPSFNLASARSKRPRAGRSIRAKHLYRGLEASTQTALGIYPFTPARKTMCLPMAAGGSRPRRLDGDACSIRLWIMPRSSEGQLGPMASICSGIPPDRRCMKRQAT